MRKSEIMEKIKRYEMLEHENIIAILILTTTEKRADNIHEAIKEINKRNNYYITTHKSFENDVFGPIWKNEKGKSLFFS
jgi:tRNA(Ser,Leu) C12 N-acetylase TAN1